MIHIIKNQDGTFDQATVRSGKLIQRSNQGYENKKDLFDTMIEDMQEVHTGAVQPSWRYVQDDTTRTSTIIKVWSNGLTETTNKAPGKKYKAK
jgi:hypothetical protein